MTEVSYPEWCKLLDKFYKHYNFYWKISQPINRYVKNEFLNTLLHRLVNFIFPKSWRDIYSFPYYYEMTSVNIKLEGGSNMDNFLADLKKVGMMATDGQKTDRIIRMVSTLDDIYFEMSSGDWWLVNDARIKMDV